MSDGGGTLLAGFNDRHVEFQCETAWIAAGLRRRLCHVLTAAAPIHPLLIRQSLTEPAPSCVELRDSTGHAVRGSAEHVLHQACKSMTAAFAGAHDTLLWLHASAAASDGSAVLLVGPAGSGKSTLVVKLVERGWCLVGDDAVPVDVSRAEAWPLPINPHVRAPLPVPDASAARVLAQPKALLTVDAHLIALSPEPIRAIVFPEYVPRAAPTTLRKLSVVSAAEVMVRACLCTDRVDRLAIVKSVFRLSGAVPRYRLRYRDPTSAAARIAGLKTPPG
jgi:hypothetical protein